MDNKKEFPKRKKNRLSDYDYSSCGAYFVTICTLQKQNIFWEKTSPSVGAPIGRPSDVVLSQYGKLAEEAIKKIPMTYPALSVDSYVIMPNHIHLLLRICADENGRPMGAPTVARVINQLKGYVSKQAGTAIWQKSYYDHIIRNREDYDEHLKYIYENPIQWEKDE